MSSERSETILKVENLYTHLFTKAGTVKAVDGVSFELRRGETLGIVGESGSGKSMTALSIVQLLPKPAGRIVGGSISLEGEELVGKSEREMRQVRGRGISMILQDPQTSLNPVFTVGKQLAEALAHGEKEQQEGIQRRAVNALRSVQIAAPEQRVDNYPHEMSGGMKQRVVGAIAISCGPKVLIADEPTTSLDVTIQAQYLRLVEELKRETGVSLIFITHDFGIVAKMCDRVAVMYAGRIVEIGPVRQIFDQPSHPYTQALIESVPAPNKKVDRLVSIPGQPPPLWDLPIGCRFADRCPHVMDKCRREYPPDFSVSTEADDERHSAACWLLGNEHE
jgi:oligopeptide/dipeptide ABC transporter ATP-binding protein